MDIQIQCDSCTHKSICKMKEALDTAKHSMELNYRYLSDNDKELADSVIFMADCRHYCREPKTEIRSDDQYSYESFL